MFGKGAAVSLVLAMCATVPVALFAQTVIDLDKGEEDVRILGAHVEDQLGFDVYAGDINADGVADLILGAVGESPLGRQGAGVVHIFYGGRRAFPKVIDLAETPGDVVIYGAEGGFDPSVSGMGDAFGQSCWSADINGDGIGDLLLGAANAPSSSGTRQAGRIYVLYGQREDLPPLIDIATTEPDLLVFGEEAISHGGMEALGGALGTTVRSGDINDDGIMDLIGSARLTDVPGNMHVGKVYVWYGGPDLPKTFDLDWWRPDLLIIGDLLLGHSGYWTSSSDVNGDGIDDILEGCQRDIPTPTGRPGNIFVTYGRRNFEPYYVIDLQIRDADIKFTGPKPYDLTGFAVCSGDVNGDGIGDILADVHPGDPQGRVNAGEMHVYYGRSDFPNQIVIQDTPGDFVVHGARPNDRLAYNNACQDVNGDGVKDILMGAINASPKDRGSAGAVYVVYGGDDLPKLLDLKKMPSDLRVLGDDAKDQLGFGIYAADVNGDGMKDILMGARRADPKGRSNAGEVYILYGRKSDAASYNKAGNAFVARKGFDEAIRRYKRALKNDPGYKEAYYNLGLTYHRKRMLDEAIDAYKQAVKLDRTYSAAHNNLGVAYDDKGAPKRAMDAYVRAIRADPKYAEGHYNLAGVYVRQGKKDKAIEALKKATDAAPRLLAAHYRLGMLYEERGQRQLAVEEWRTCVDINPRIKLGRKAAEALKRIGAW